MIEPFYIIVVLFVIILWTIIYILNSLFPKLYPDVEKKKIFRGLSKNISIVTSFFKEDMSWLYGPDMVEFLNKVHSLGIKVNLYVYIKSDIPVSNKNQLDQLFDNVEIKYLPNVGMCGHTLIYHICTHYDKKELLIFLPGSSTNKIKIELYKDILKNGWKYDYYFTYTFYSLKTDFMINTYEVTDPQNQTSESLNLKLSPIRPFGKWYEYMTSPYKKLSLENYYFTNIKDLFSVHTTIIQRMPINFYLDLLDQLSESINSEVCHYAERMWYPLFTSLANEIHS
jgi:hypothetical protein